MSTPAHHSKSGKRRNDSIPHGPDRPPEDARTWATVLWLVQLFSTPVTLVLFLIKRRQSQFIDWHGKQCLNLFLTHFLLGCVLLLVFAAGYFGGEMLDMPWLTLIMGGTVILLMIALVGLGLTIKIIAALKANAGERWKPPLCLRLFK
jgi:uncharacterized Tic20 family protein